MIQIIHADVMDGLRQIPDQTVQCVVTSPPYIPGSYELTGEVWGLRDYGVDGQIGLEKTPEEFIQKMVEVFREVKRVLRDDGTVWLNLGDCYAASSNTGGTNSIQGTPKRIGAMTDKKHNIPDGLKQKDLVGMPWRVAFALQADGWYLRSDIIWSKPNPIPESVTDRPTKSHEYLFLLTKKPRYYYDADAVREKYSESYLNDPRHITGPTKENIKSGYNEAKAQNPKQLHRLFDKEIGAGRNRRTVWEIATQPFPEAHFACVDDATEALTTDGWKNIYGLKDGDIIAAFDGNRLSWQPATFHKYQFSGEMVVASSRDLSMWLTPNHRVVCRDYRGKGEWKIKRADELLGREEIPTAAKFDCDTYGALINPDVAELTGWILTDGGYNEGKTITLYQTGGRGKHERIEQLFDSLNIKYKLYQRDRGHGDERAYSFGGEVAAFIREVFPNKEGNYGILATWSEKDLNALWQGMTEGDGNIRSDGRISFVGNSEKVNFYQALCLRLGMTCRISRRHGESYGAFVSKKTSTSMRGTNGTAKTIQSNCFYDGPVWCPSVRSGMWLARRNGRPFITGNTFPEALVEPCIKAGTSERGCCSVCGAPWKRVVEKGDPAEGYIPGSDRGAGSGMVRGFCSGTPGYQPKITTTGWQPSCSCNADTVPCIVLDPFGGSGTVGKVARDLNRKAILIELNAEYIKIARERLRLNEQLGAFA